jgi:hypothetical protein
MTVLELIDQLYEGFADALGVELAEHARDLPVSLKLAPMRVVWSRVFSYEVTLGAPALFAEAMPQVKPAVVRDAVTAHMLAVIGAFGGDRIEDQQIVASSEVLSVLAQVRTARDAALGRVRPGHAPPLDSAVSDEVARRAIEMEREVFLGSGATDFGTYQRISLDKQSAGLVASMALAEAAGWDARRCASVRRTLESVALSLQMYDDAVDWEDDQLQGGSWAGALARTALGRPAGSSIDRPAILGSGVLRAMLERARKHARSAGRRSRALGASMLSDWAVRFEGRLAALETAEAFSGGYAMRARALSAWAREVLA